MNETQRAAAERLAFEQWYDAQLEGRINPWDVWQAAALLRELLADPQGEPVAWYYIEDPWGANEWHWMTDSPESQNCDPSDWTPVYAAPQQRKPLTPSMQAEVECDCLVAWNASTYGHSAQDTVHPMFLSAFLRGYRAAERAHGITGEPT